ncbi:MAG: hypothetical protein AB1Z38_05090 [Desulfotignum sp.]
MGEITHFPPKSMNSGWLWRPREKIKIIAVDWQSRCFYGISG